MGSRVLTLRLRRSLCLGGHRRLAVVAAGDGLFESGGVWFSAVVHVESSRSACVPLRDLRQTWRRIIFLGTANVGAG